MTSSRKTRPSNYKYSRSARKTRFLSSRSPSLLKTSSRAKPKRKNFFSSSSKSPDKKSVHKKKASSKKNNSSKIYPSLDLKKQNEIIQQSMMTSDPALTRLARQLYIGNLPIGIKFSEILLIEFFTIIMKRLGITTPEPVIAVWLSSPGNFCFIELRSVSDTTKCLTLLENLTLSSNVLKVGRPPDYSIPNPQLTNYVVGAIPPGLDQDSKVIARDTAAHKNKKMVKNNKEKRYSVQFPLVSGTPLRASLTPVKVNIFPDGSSIIKPFYKEYKDKIDIFDKKKLFLDAPEDIKKILIRSYEKITSTIPKILTFDRIVSDPCPPSLVIVINNIVRASELVDDLYYYDLMYDIRDGCMRYGDVASVVIPRPGYIPGEFGVGKVFVEYYKIKGAMKAKKYLQKRYFCNRKLTVKYYEEYKFKANIF